MVDTSYGNAQTSRFIVVGDAAITGPITINPYSELQNSLALAVDNTPFGTGTITVSSNGILNLYRNTSDATAILGGLAGAGRVHGDGSGVKIFKIGANDESTEFSGVIQNGSATHVAVTKIGEGTLTLLGVNTFSGALRVEEGVLALSGANTFTGQITVAAGTLSITSWNADNASGPLGQSSSKVVLGGSGTTGTLEYTGILSNSPATLRGIELATGGVGKVQLSSAGTTRSNHYVHLSGSKIVGSGELIIDTSYNGVYTSRFIIVGDADISGPVTVNPHSELQNSLASADDNMPFGTGTVTVSENGILTVFRSNTHGTAVLGGLAGAGTVRGESPGTKTFKIGANDESTEFSGVIQNGSATHVAVTKFGEGTLTLSGTNTFTGATNVEKGTLLVNGSLTGTSGVTVHGGATLGGTGSIAATVAGAGWISPGNSAGILTVQSVDPSAGLNASFEFGQTESPNYANAADSVNDVLRITGQAPISVPFSTDNIIDVYFGVAPSLGDVFRGGVYVDAAGDPQGLADFYDAVADARYNYYVHDGGGYVTLSDYASWLDVAVSTVAETATFGGGGAVSGGVMQFTVIPEPGTWLMLLAAGVSGMLAGRRRRR